VFGLNPAATPATAPTPAPAPEPEPVRKAPRLDGLRQVVSDVGNRLVRRVVSDSVRVLNRGSKLVHEQMLRDHAEVIRSAVAPVYAACSDWGISPSLDAGKLADGLLSSVALAMNTRGVDCAAEVEKTFPAQFVSAILGDR
jgi:hypothetical protein